MSTDTSPIVVEETYTAAPNVVWNARHAFVTMTHVGNLASWSATSLDPLEAAAFVGSQFGVAGPLVFAAVLAIGFRKSQWTSDWRNRLLLAFSMPILLLITVNGLLGNAYANWAATAYVAAFVFVTSYWVRLNIRAAIVSLAINLIFTAAIYYYGPITRAVSIQALAQLDPWERYRGWPEVGRQIGAIVSRTSAPVLLSDNRKDLVEFRYYVRPAPAHIVKWNPFHVLGDHYDLTTDIEPFADGPMVIATRYPLRYFRSFFCHNRLLGTVAASSRAGREQIYSVYLFEGFRGYDRKSRECRARPRAGEKQ